MLEKEEEEKTNSEFIINERKEKEKKINFFNSQINYYKCLLNKKNNIIIEEIPKTLYNIYNILRSKSLVMKEKAISLLNKIIEKINESQIQYNIFRDLLLENTFIIFALIQIYIINNKDKKLQTILPKLLKSLLVGNFEIIKIFMNLFPITLFEKIQIDPEPINWINEWEDFLKNILQDYSEPKLIWNGNCREELIKFLENVLINYEKNVINNNNIKNEEIKNNKKEIISKEINESKNKQINFLNKIIQEKRNENIINYKYIKINYSSLQKEVFVWKYYLKKLIKENQGAPSFNNEIENPKKLWKNIKKELCLEKNANRIIIMLKVLILLYKNYYQSKRKTKKDLKPLGIFKDYEFFINLYQSNDNIEIKSYIIQLLFVSINCQEQKIENRKELLNKDDIGLIIISYIKSIEATLKNVSNSLNYNIDDNCEKQCNSFYIDNEKDVLKIYNDSDSKLFINNGNFINYSNYFPIDVESWKLCDDKYKMLSIVSLLYIFLKKQLKSNQKDNKNDLPVFPIPKITKILYEPNNYKAFLKLLLYDNLNLSLQALTLFIYYIIDLHNDGVGSDFCVIDILFILMIKYKSSKLLRAIEKISSWYVKKNKNTVYEELKLSEDEIEFFNFYTSPDNPKDPAVKNRKPIVLLARYFPIQMIYYYMTHKFEEFMNLIYTKEEVNNCQIIWNRKTLEDLLKNVRNNIEKNKDKLAYDKNYRYDYTLMNKKEKSCFIYYIHNDCDQVLESINEIHYYTMINMLCLNQYLVDIDYVKLLHKVIEKCILTLSRDTIDKIKRKISDFLCPTNIKDMAEDLNQEDDKDDSDLILLKHYIIIFSLIDENEYDILKYNNNINLAINNILSRGTKLNFNKEDKNAKILYILLNYLLEQPKIKKLLETIENEKEKDNSNSESIDKSNFINNENVIIQNQNEYDNISKMVQQISRLIDTLFQVNPPLLMAFLKYFTFLCEKDKNIINYINMTIIPLQLLRLCTKYKPNKNDDTNDKLFFTIFRALRTMVKNNQFLNEIMEKLICNQRLMKNMLCNGTNFLKELTQGYQRPKSIWGKKDLEQLIKYLDKVMIEYFEKQKNVRVIYNKIKESEKEQIDDELKINNIYVRVFNANPKQKHTFTEKEKETFLSELVKEFIKSNNIHHLKHILWSICNAMKFLQIEVQYLLNISFEDLLNKYYSYVYHITHLTEEEKEQSIKDEEDDSQFYKNKDLCPKNEKKAIVCLLFIEFLSNNETTAFYFKETNLIYSFIILIEYTNYIEGIKIINNTMNNLFNYYIKKNNNESSIRRLFSNEFSFDLEKAAHQDKKIKAIFLFLFKKLIFYTQNKKNSTEPENNQYIELFNIINMFSNCKVFHLSLKEMYKYYIPAKMVDNLFHSISQEQRNNEKLIQKIFADWLKDKIDFPDLKWNSNSFNRSYTLLSEDCKLILNDKSLIDNFDNIYIETDRITENKIFFECPDEYKIDAIYLRLFNKEPNYNIGHNLPIFLLHTIDDMLDNLEHYYIFCYDSNPQIDQKLIEKLKKFKEKCLITSLTSIMLMIEQINFNNNNPNLILATNKELNNSITKKEEFQKELLQLIKFAFDYQKLLSKDSCKALVLIQKIIFSSEINREKNEIKIFFNSEIRIIYLQILYLISLNKNRIDLLSDNFQDNIILDYYFYLLKQENSKEIDTNLNINDIIINTNMKNKEEILFVSDYEYVLLCCIIIQLFTVDISHIPIILAGYLDEFILLAEKRLKVRKYVQLLFDTIETDSQYGDSLIRSKKKYNFNFINENSKINEIKIWRLECGEKKEVKYDKKNIHYCNYTDFVERNNDGEMKDYEFPIIFDDSINHFKYDEYNDDIIDIEIKKITDYEKDRKNETFIIMKDIIDQCQSI